MTELEILRNKQRGFAQERDWDQFHSPKNLAMALLGEAGELIEHFQWLTEDESRSLSPEKKADVSTEMADVLLYLVRLADKLDIDLYQSSLDKLELNSQKYPADQVKGSARKYSEY
ncbi:MAG: nucleotide pyrophosphohydrolase [Halieaceae bacterium]|nr:nucleotide pyrophosphohydrolase [Halieaceae bacterium]